MLRVVEPYADAAKCLCTRVFAAQGKNDEAEPLYKEALAIRKKVYGDEHPDVAGSLNNLAWLLRDQDSASDEAKRLGKQALEISRKVLGPDHPKTIAYRNAWACLRADLPERDPMGQSGGSRL